MPLAWKEPGASIFFGSSTRPATSKLLHTVLLRISNWMLSLPPICRPPTKIWVVVEAVGSRSTIIGPETGPWPVTGSTEPSK
ncbi:hypothetical protein D3C81_2060980 [compost metagenome]